MVKINFLLLKAKDKDAKSIARFFKYLKKLENNQFKQKKLKFNI